MGAFATGTKAYTYIFDETVSSVNINATSTHSEAMISINGEASTKHTASASVTPVDGNSVNIVITAEDGHSTDTYTITFERKKSDVNTLNTLSDKVIEVKLKEFVLLIEGSELSILNMDNHEMLIKGIINNMRFIR